MYLCEIKINCGTITKLVSTYIEALNYVNELSFDYDIIKYHIKKG